jgi:tetratricopeptide (TPR) repeat protein
MSAALRNLLITTGAVTTLIFSWYLLKPAILSHQKSDFATTTIPLNGGSVKIVGRSGIDYSINESTTTVSVPNYRAPLQFDASISGEVKVALLQELARDQALLDANRENFDAWVDIGRVRKLANDYKGAAEVWEFVSILWPTNTVSYNNLGDLYMNFLKNYPKAETNYKMMIQFAPANIDAYENLFYLYRDLYKTNTDSAKKVLELGLKNNPGEPRLQALLN